jgi:hypothetical protein
MLEYVPAWEEPKIFSMLEDVQQHQYLIVDIMEHSALSPLNDIRLVSQGISRDDERLFRLGKQVDRLGESLCSTIGPPVHLLQISVGVHSRSFGH